MIQLTQYNGKILELETRPTKIISLVPSITENLIQFGTVPIARTSFCIEPKQIVDNIPVIGGTKTPRVSKIISMKPDLVIANQEENIRAHVEEIETTGIPVWTTFPKELNEVVVLMKELAQLADDPYSASNWIEKTKEVLRHPREGKISAVTLIWKDPWMAVGQETYTSHLLSFCGIKNPVKGRYPEVTEDAIREWKPDVIILPTEPYDFSEGDLNYWQQRYPAILFPGEDLLWSGTRLIRAVEALAKIAKRFEKKAIK